MSDSHLDYDDSIPEEFICPITHDVFQEPVQDLHNPHRTYERAAILAWIGSKGTDPFTRRQLKARSLIPNTLLKTKIYLWQREAGRLPPSTADCHADCDNEGVRGLFRQCPATVQDDTATEETSSRYDDDEVGVTTADGTLEQLILEFDAIERYYDERCRDLYSVMLARTSPSGARVPRSSQQSSPATAR